MCCLYLKMNKRPAQVYRCYDENWNPLYFGATVDLVKRFKAHLRSEWIGMMRYVVLEGYATRPDAFEQERRAINLELPYFNKPYRHDRPAGSRLATFGTLIASGKLRADRAELAA